jgi:Tfp pilus assembly protein PilF
MHHGLVPKFLSLLFAISLTASPVCAQSHLNPRNDNGVFGDPFGDSAATGRISGTVRTFDGHTINNANIEARNVEQGNRSSTTHSDSRGFFALYNISPGDYEVTASNGISEAHARVQVSRIFVEASVDFRLPQSIEKLKTGNGSTVSFSQYNVPAKARLLYEKAARAMKHRKLGESSEKVNAALAIYPKFSEALTLRGILQENAGNETAAIADYEKAIQYDTNYLLAYIALSSALNTTGHFKESLPLLDQAERLEPNAWQTYFELARAHLGTGEFASAMQNIDRASELQGGQQKEIPELHLVRGYALVGLHEIPRAVQELQTFLARVPNGRYADSAHKVLDQLQARTVAASK